MTVIYWNTSDGENIVHEIRNVESSEEARGLVQHIESKGPYRAHITE